MTSLSPQKKKQKLAQKMSFEDLSVNELGQIFSFLEGAAKREEKIPDSWPPQLRPLFCREWSKVSRQFVVSSPELFNALAFCPESLLWKIYLLKLPDGYRYLRGEGSNSNLRDGDEGEEAIDLDPQYISRFSHLKHLHIAGAQMKGGYPFIFNSFAQLRTLTMRSVPHIEFNLDMVSSIPLLEGIEFSDCNELEGSIGSLRALKETLCFVRIFRCEHVSGDFMELSDYPKLKWLILCGCSVTGDVRKLGVDKFPSLCKICLPDSVYGARIIYNIADAHEIMQSLASRAGLFEGHRWLLSENSPDYYPSIRDYAAPLMVEFVTEGSRLGWRWTSGGAGANTYPPFEGGYWIVHCETNWIYPYSNYDDEPFGSIVDSCSSHLRFGQSGAPLIPFEGFYEPPSEEQYRDAIQDARNKQQILQMISNPNFDPMELLEGDNPLISMFRSRVQYLMGDNENNGGSEAGAKLADNGGSDAGAELADDGGSDVGAELAEAAASMESESNEEDSCSDVIDFGIDDIHTTTDLERQINILCTFILSDHNDDPRLTWRAFWSMEERHDVMLGGIRKKHFNRWPRENLPENDPYRDEKSGAIYFPGMHASHDAKCAWSGVVVEECAANDMRPVFDHTWERDYDIPSLDEAPSVISDILLACAPDQLSVCLYIDRSMVESFIALATVQKDDETKTNRSFYFSSSMTKEEKEAMDRRFEKSKQNPGLESIKKFLSSPYIRDDVPRDIKLNSDEDVSGQDAAEKLEKFKRWLQEESACGGTLHQEEITQKLPPRRFNKLANTLSSLRSLNTEKDLLLLARRDDVPKDMSTKDVLDDMISSLGLYEDIVGLNQTSSRNPDIHGYSYITSDLIGGNIHYPDVGGRASVAFTWSSTQKLTEDHVYKKQNRLAFDTEFVRNAEAMKEASNGQVCFIIWPRASDGDRGRVAGYGNDFPPDTTAVTFDNAHLIWLPGDYDSIEEQIYNYCVNGGGDNFSRIRFTTTRSGNTFWQAVLAYFQKVIVKGRHSYLDQYPSIPNEDSLKLCLLLGLTRTLIESEESFQDTEYTKKEIKEFFDSLSSKWRSVLSESDDVLGLGMAGNLDSNSASREGLYVMLEFYRSKFDFYFSDMEDGQDDEDLGEFEFDPFPDNDHMRTRAL
ncbi:hypothetical protein ACHAXM_004184 [Skeletonema potamos]